MRVNLEGQETRKVQSFKGKSVYSPKSRRSFCKGFRHSLVWNSKDSRPLSEIPSHLFQIRFLVTHNHLQIKVHGELSESSKVSAQLRTKVLKGLVCQSSATNKIIRSSFFRILKINKNLSIQISSFEKVI